LFAYFSHAETLAPKLKYLCADGRIGLLNCTPSPTPAIGPKAFDARPHSFLNHRPLELSKYTIIWNIALPAGKRAWSL